MGSRGFDGPMTAPEGTSRAGVLGATVQFFDDDGMLWHVAEHDGRQVPVSQGDQCLVFRSDNVVRRVWDYPPGWRDLAAMSLAAVSWHR